jgi:hypothetical protein
MRRLVDQRWSVGAQFTLRDAYGFQEELAQVYPENRHLTDSIRVGLQHLRREGVIEMLSPGVYRRLR